MHDVKSGKLNDIVAGMVAEDERCHFVLSRGLVLAFTPQIGDTIKDGARFVWSRWKDDPSGVEDRIMRKSIVAGMRKVSGRVVIGGPTFRTGLAIKPGWGSSMLYWSWVSSSLLLGLVGRERERALEWVRLG